MRRCVLLMQLVIKPMRILRKCHSKHSCLSTCVQNESDSISKCYNEHKINGIGWKIQLHYIKHAYSFNVNVIFELDSNRNVREMLQMKYSNVMKLIFGGEKAFHSKAFIVKTDEIL